MNEDKIHINGSWEVVEDRDLMLLNIQIVINGVPVPWNDINIYSLALYSINCKPLEHPDAIWSSFQPFSCSCGVAGCAGIWDGIHVKMRKHSVEWRAKERDGYKFLGKQFFSFDRKQYVKAIKSFFNWLKTESDWDYKLCVDLGYYDGDETTTQDFFVWLEDQKEWENFIEI